MGGAAVRAPVGGASAQTTNWLVRPLRKATPPWALGFGLRARLCAGYYLAFTLALLLALPGGFGMRLMAANLLSTVLNLFEAAAYVLLLGFVAMASSFSKPYRLYCRCCIGFSNLCRARFLS